MVEIIAIVRPNKTAETKQALLDIGKPGFTCVRVSGRGKQAVVRTFMDGSVITTGLNNKRMFIIEAENDDKALKKTQQILTSNNFLLDSYEITIQENNIKIKNIDPSSIVTVYDYKEI